MSGYADFDKWYNSLEGYGDPGYDGPADEDNPYLNPDLLPLPRDARHEHDETL